MKCEDLKFYHGTSAIGATYLLQGKQFELFEEMKLKEFGEELWAELMEVCGDTQGFCKVLHESGSEFCASAPVGLDNFVHGNNTSTYSYGDLYVTNSLRMAAGYSLRNIAGSELQQFLLDGFKALEFVDREAGQGLRHSYPDLVAWLEKPKDPVVLEFSNIAIDRLISPNGGGPIAVEWLEMMLSLAGDGDSVNLSFRLLNPSVTDVSGILQLDRKTTEADKVGDFEFIKLSHR